MKSVLILGFVFVAVMVTTSAGCLWPETCFNDYDCYYGTCSHDGLCISNYSSRSSSGYSGWSGNYSHCDPDDWCVEDCYYGDCYPGEYCGSDGRCYEECGYEKCWVNEYCGDDGYCHDYDDYGCRSDYDCPRDTYCASDGDCYYY